VKRWSDGLTFSHDYVQSNIVGIARLQDALERLTKAIRDVETELAAMEEEHDPLAAHIFISRRHYRNAKGNKKRKTPRDDRPTELQYCLRAWLSRDASTNGSG
jgi:hypothetical protein